MAEQYGTGANVGWGQNGGMSLTVPVSTPAADTRADPSREWTTIVWDDPVNLMSYVTRVFTGYFGYPARRAHQLMLEVHEQGRAVVSHGSREEMEADVKAMHRFGLRATLGRSDEQ